MAKNPTFHGRTKHIGIKYHFIREQVSENSIRLEYYPSEEMVADILTKGLKSSKIRKATTFVWNGQST